jgi:hypothetical protein
MTNISIAASVAFEELNRPLVLFRGSSTAEGAKIAASAGPRVDLPGIQAVLPRFEFANHATLADESCGRDRIDKRNEANKGPFSVRAPLRRAKVEAAVLSLPRPGGFLTMALPGGTYAVISAVSYEQSDPFLNCVPAVRRRAHSHSGVGPGQRIQMA